MVGIIKKDNEQAFIRLYDQYVSQIYRFIFLKTSSSQDAEDLTSEVFFRFWKKMAILNDKSRKEAFENTAKTIDNPRALLYRIANNLIIDFYRKKDNNELMIIDSDENFLANMSGETDLYKKAEFDSELKQIVKSIDKIKNEYQNVVIWHYLEDLSIKEISQILDKSQGAVRVLIHRALASLKKKIKKNS